MARRADMAEVMARLDALSGEVERVRLAVEGHEAWHRDTSVSGDLAARSRRIAVLAVIVSAVSAAASASGFLTFLMTR